MPENRGLIWVEGDFFKEDLINLNERYSSLESQSQVSAIGDRELDQFKLECIKKRQESIRVSPCSTYSTRITNPPPPPPVWQFSKACRKWYDTAHSMIIRNILRKAKRHLLIALSRQSPPSAPGSVKPPQEIVTATKLRVWCQITNCVDSWS